jgi:hypothetical protein
MVDFLTTAWTTADSPNPRISAQVIAHVIDAVMESACAMAPMSFTSLRTGHHAQDALAAVTSDPAVRRLR